MMWNSFTGLMARRLLVNWRVPVEVAARVLPRGRHNLRPKVVGGWAIAGLCLVRIEQLRPANFPAMVGLSSENLAIRMGVEWEGADGAHNSVLIFRRETASRVNGLIAPRAGFGVNERSEFRVREEGPQTEIAVLSGDANLAYVRVSDADVPMRGSALRDVAEAEAFFRGGACGYSPGLKAGTWVGANLRMHRWDLRCMHVEAAHSSYLEKLFGGTAVIDSAFVMRDVMHTWTACAPQQFGLAPAEKPVRDRIALAA